MHCLSSFLLQDMLSSLHELLLRRPNMKFTMNMLLTYLLLCSSRKYPYPPHGRLMEIPRGRVVSKAKFFEWKYDIKRKFLDGWGVEFEKPSMGGVRIFSGTTHSVAPSPVVIKTVCKYSRQILIMNNIFVLVRLSPHGLPWTKPNNREIKLDVTWSQLTSNGKNELLPSVNRVKIFVFVAKLIVGGMLLFLCDLMKD